MATLKVGDSVRVIGSTPVGSVVSVDGGRVNVRYDHRPDVFTFGDYPVSHVEVVAKAAGEKVGERESETVATVKPKATTKDILPTADRV